MRTIPHALLRVVVIPAAMVFGLLTACTDWYDNPIEAQDVMPEEVSAFSGAGVGGACAEDADCRTGLACADGSCQPSGASPEDSRCLLSAECASGLVCSWSGFCGPAGEGQAGDECTSASDCAAGLFCQMSGLSGFCTDMNPDARDLDQPCASTSDCMAGLVCSTISDTCVPGSLLMNPDLFMGVACPDQAELDMPFGVRSLLPGTEEGGFYELPFPNDLRLNDGFVDLSDHPRPGPGVLGIDVVDAVLTALSSDAKGWSRMPAIYLRFTRAVDVDTLTTEGAGAAVQLIDLDTGEQIPVTVAFVDKRNKYICQNHLLVHPSWSRLLAPGHTHAVVITTDVQSRRDDEGAGEAAQALDALPALLGASAPAGALEKRAWDLYAPLRQWLGAGTVPVERVAGATVFTTTPPPGIIPKLRDLAMSTDPPVLIPDSITLCADGVNSPCATPGWEAVEDGDFDSRDCPAEAPVAWREVHAKVTLPMFQAGTRPYLDEGGALALEGGEPTVTGREEVCMGLVLPNDPPPAEGWPVLIYGHGTKGSFRSGLVQLAESVTPMGIAVMTIDQPMHGDRRGVELDPGPLFYNYANPPAAKGNLYQGAADNFSLLRLAKAIDQDLPGVGRVAFDDAHVVLVGHSQGATTGPLAVPFMDGLAGAVFTGAGASLVHGLLGKKEPHDASVGARSSLQELEVDENHPVLHLIQAYFDDTDPMLYGPMFARHAPQAPIDVLNVFGWDDSYTPWRTSVIFAALIGGGFVQDQAPPESIDTAGFHPVEDLGMTAASYPVQGNVGPTGQEVTVASTAFVSDGNYDGHFVGMRNSRAVKQLLAFLQGLMGPDAPIVSE